MRITPRPPPGVHPQQTEVGGQGESDLAVERERTRRVIVYVLLGVIGLVALAPVVCIAAGRLSAATASELYVALAWLGSLARRPLTFYFRGERMPAHGLRRVGRVASTCGSGVPATRPGSSSRGPTRAR
jgi:hypothetical protein